jgi:hypothetical protein
MIRRFYTTVLTLLGIALATPGCGASAAEQARIRGLAASSQRLNPAGPDRIRRELSGVIEVVRLPAGPESTWVARVRKDTPDTSGIARFNTAVPHFLTWTLNNTRVDLKALLASLPATAPAQAILADSLLADSAFNRAAIVEVGLFHGTVRTVGGRIDFMFDDLVTFATRYFRLDADSAQRIVFSLAEKTEQLRDVPIRRWAGVDAWFYSFLRPIVETDALPATRAIIGSVIQEASAVRTRAAMDSLEGLLWRRLAAEPEFRNHIKAQLDRNITARQFSYRMTPGRPWVDALVQTYPGTVSKIPVAVRTRFHLDTTFYGKYVDADGIPVIAAPKVPDEALLVARDIIKHMLKARPDIRADLIRKGSRLGVIATSDSLLDIPEYSDWDKPGRRDGRLHDLERANYDQPGGIGSMTARQYWNRRARGMGGTFTTTSEENLLGYPGSRDFGWGLTVHEWAHNIHDTIERIDKKLQDELEAAYKEANAKKMYRNANGLRNGAVNTIDEYWAVGSQWWFWTNTSRTFVKDGVSTTVWSPADLERYDPKLYSILSRVYPADHHIPADVHHAFKWPR